MPWQLTTPISTGGLDPAGDYAQIKIATQQNDSNAMRMILNLEYGNTVDGNWVSGVIPIGLETGPIIDGSDYATLITTAMPEEGETTYEAVKRGLYEYLATAGVIGPGSVV